MTTIVFLASLFIPPFLFVLMYVIKAWWKQQLTLEVIRIATGLTINMLVRNQGKLPDSWSLDKDGRVVIEENVTKRLSSTKIQWKADLDNYDNYLLLCGYDITDQSSQIQDPPCYLETAFMIPTIRIISCRQFPLSPLALIHTSQTIKMYCPLSLDESPTFSLRCCTSQFRLVSKGIEIDFTFKAYHDDKLVWESVMTVLSRDLSTRKRIKTAGGVKKPLLNEKEIEGESSVFFNVPESTGWEYARISSDYNLHHLNSLTSKLVGYPQPMVHGMWTLSRVLAILNNKVDLNPGHTPYPVLVRAEFKQPLFMPNTAVLKYRPIDSLQADDPVFDYCCNNESKTIRYCVFSESKSSLPAGVGQGNQTPMSFNMNGFVTYQADI